MGVMDEIRGHLSDGKGSREIIQLGYAPGSVYRLQREFRERPAEENVESVEGATHVSVVKPESPADLPYVILRRMVRSPYSSASGEAERGHRMRSSTR